MNEIKENWTGVIKTRSGIKFDVKNPTPSMIYIKDIASGLANTCRYNGQIPTFYSVAEHSVRVYNWLLENGHASLAFEGLMHDSAEAYTGDIVRPIKILPEFSSFFTSIEANIDIAISKAFSVYLYPINTIVKQADIAVYHWELDHIRTGNVTGWSPFTAEKEFLKAFGKCYEQRNSKNQPHLTNFIKENKMVNNSITDLTDSTNTKNNKIKKNQQNDSPRRDLLNEAANLVDGDRNVQYGDPSADFLRTATYWNAHIYAVLDRKTRQIDGDAYGNYEDYEALSENILGPEDVAIMMALLKLSRLGWSNEKRDTWVDLAGYAACGWNIISDKDLQNE